MAKGGSSQPKSREKQVHLARHRFRKRLNRRGKHYGHSAAKYSSGEIKNPKFRLKQKPKGFRNVTLPAKLSQGTRENLERVIEICAEVRHFALDEPVKRLVVDFRDVEEIESSVALMLLAELKRCISYSSSRTYITGTYPNTDAVAQLLSDLGFFQALNVKDPEVKLLDADRTFVKLTQHRQTDAALIDRMLSLFSKEIAFDDQERKTLHLAFLECMDNVRQHAYIWKSNRPHLYKEWWMAGFIDHRQQEIHFLFYDQGLGIPYTIRKRKHRRVLDRVQHWNDADWISRALRRRESRHPSQRRGHGLKRLRRFARVSRRGTTLKIVSNYGCYVLTTDNDEHKLQMKYNLDGTLIQWSLNRASDAGVVYE